ncbi:site-specific DNA-methyltransferase [Pectobacterium punjabense]|uniref:site-specific DNA-methyltransferase (adenine-specific) n=1 Tax=Pectobacterium punjabense TaxID=2108399 RepID=A0ABX6L7G6_9GAMM|nr:site-specific DNA-methyltransferase [Pectobacterium punjabense]MBS4429716.1 site-specific DNA-methyltransferase [Pectobacterium punjabense]PTA64151.1 site-specific DNA-methyltransferase [Pectobacterium punjabense]QJA22196.1 site-specific DNA-methyltransferase [Pectobacterium punjabense]
MYYKNGLFSAIGIDPADKKKLNAFCKISGVPVARLKYYDEENIYPSGSDLIKICTASGLNDVLLKLKMGFVDASLMNVLRSKSDEIYSIINSEIKGDNLVNNVNFNFQTKLGKLYQGDCIEFLKSVDSDSVDMIFADPPFNLDKIYPSGMDDNLKHDKYIGWCQEWIYQCVRVLKHGGSFFIWNLPKWNTELSAYLSGMLTFRHWIATDIKYSLPIQSKLYPSHYSMLYYIKGKKPNVFHPDRLPMQVCPKCYGDLKDYGGYKDKMNPKGVNMTDIWYDIPPVRHAKYKRREGSNELSIKLLDRVIEMSTNEGDVILDPFGGSGTTYIAAEIKNRKWIGSELGPLDVIIDRFNRIDEESKIVDNYRSQINNLFPDNIKAKRKQRKIWTDDDFNK